MSPAPVPAERYRRPQPVWYLLRAGWARRGRALGVLDVWIGWERLLAALQRIRPIREEGVLRYAVRRYRGPRVRLHDGGRLGPGAVILELHLDNHRFAGLAAAGVRPLGMVRLLREDLHALARLVEGGALGPVAALHGTTFMAPAAPILGFEFRRLPHTLHLRLDRFFMAGLVLLYNPGGWRSVEHHSSRWPGELWMSTGELRRRYL